MSATWHLLPRIDVMMFCPERLVKRAWIWISGKARVAVGEAPKELILTALELERSEGTVIADKVGDTACIFLAGRYRAEQAIAERLIRIVSGRLHWPWIDEEKAMPWIEKRNGLQLVNRRRKVGHDRRPKLVHASG